MKFEDIKDGFGDFYRYVKTEPTAYVAGLLLVTTLYMGALTYTSSGETAVPNSATHSIKTTPTPKVRADIRNISAGLDDKLK